MIIRVITWIIVAVVIYRILNKYILPIFRISSAASSHMRKMQEQMNEMNRQMNENANRNNQPKKVKKDGDYIDYEEIK